MKRKGNGIFTIAVGKAIYGQYAYNLALSVKASDPSVLFAVAVNGGEVAPYIKKGQEDGIIDIVTQVPDKELWHTKTGKFRAYALKTCMQKYTPFKQTLFIDADSAVFSQKKIGWLLDELKSYTFACHCQHIFIREILTEKDKLIGWGNLKDQVKYFNIEAPYIYRLHSQMLYFTEEASLVFEKSEKVLRKFEDMHPGSSMAIDYIGSIPDEPCLSLGLALSGMPNETHIWKPIAEGGNYKRKDFWYMVANFWGITVPGDHQKDRLHLRHVNWYNYVLKEAGLKLGLKPYTWPGKVYKENREARKHVSS